MKTLKVDAAGFFWIGSIRDIQKFAEHRGFALGADFLNQYNVYYHMLLDRWIRTSGPKKLLIRTHGKLPTKLIPVQPPKKKGVPS